MAVWQEGGVRQGEGPGALEHASESCERLGWVEGLDRKGLWIDFASKVKHGLMFSVLGMEPWLSHMLYH